MIIRCTFGDSAPVAGGFQALLSRSAEALGNTKSACLCGRAREIFHNLLWAMLNCTYRGRSKSARKRFARFARR